MTTRADSVFLRMGLICPICKILRALRFQRQPEGTCAIYLADHEFRRSSCGGSGRFMGKIDPPPPPPPPQFICTSCDRVARVHRGGISVCCDAGLRPAPAAAPAQAAPAAAAPAAPVLQREPGED